MIDEVSDTIGWDRKHAIKALNGQVSLGQGVRKRGLKAIYSEEVKHVIVEIWKRSEQPCGKLLKPTIPPLVGQLRKVPQGAPPHYVAPVGDGVNSAFTISGGVSTTDVEAAVNDRPKIVAPSPESTIETLPASYPILFHSGTDVWLLLAGHTAEASILLTGEPPPGQIVNGPASSYPASSSLPAGNYVFGLSIVDLVPDLAPTANFNGLLLNLSYWNNSIYSNVSSGGACPSLASSRCPFSFTCHSVRKRPAGSMERRTSILRAKVRSKSELFGMLSASAEEMRGKFLPFE